MDSRSKAALAFDGAFNFVNHFSSSAGVPLNSLNSEDIEICFAVLPFIGGLSCNSRLLYIFLSLVL